MDNTALFDSDGYLTPLGQEIDAAYKKQMSEMAKKYLEKGCKYHEIIAVISGTAQIQIKRHHIIQRDAKEKESEQK